MEELEQLNFLLESTKEALAGQQMAAAAQREEVEALQAQLADMRRQMTERDAQLGVCVCVCVAAAGRWRKGFLSAVEMHAVGGCFEKQAHMCFLCTQVMLLSTGYLTRAASVHMPRAWRWARRRTRDLGALLLHTGHIHVLAAVLARS